MLVVVSPLLCATTILSPPPPMSNFAYPRLLHCCTTFCGVRQQLVHLSVIMLSRLCLPVVFVMSLPPRRHRCRHRIYRHPLLVMPDHLHRSTRVPRAPNRNLTQLNSSAWVRPKWPSLRISDPPNCSCPSAELNSIFKKLEKKTCILCR